MATRDKLDDETSTESAASESKPTVQATEGDEFQDLRDAAAEVEIERLKQGIAMLEAEGRGHELDEAVRKRAPEILRMLEQLVEDPDPEMRRQCQAMIDRIRGRMS